MEKLSYIFKKYLFWGVLGLFIFIPLYPKFPLFNVPGTYVAVRLEDFFIGIVILWWIIAILPRIREFVLGNIFLSFFLFWAIGALSLLSAIALTNTVVPHIGLLHYLRRVEMMALFFVSMSAFTTIKHIKIWLMVMFTTTLLIIFYGFGQQLLSFPVISTTNKEFSKGLILFLSPEARVNSTFAGHYDLASYLSLFLTMALSIWIFYKGVLQKLVIALVGLSSFILLSLTAARVSFFATFLGLTSVLFISGHRKLIILLFVLSILPFIAFPELRHRTVATLTVNLLGGGGPKYSIPPQKENSTKTFSIENAATDLATLSGVPVDVAPGEPLNTTELGVYRSFGIRLNEEWPRAIRAFWKNPFLGTGYSSITISTDNDYLRSLGETGLLGTLSLMLIFYLILKKIITFLRKRSLTLVYYLNLGILCALLTIFLTIIFIDVLEASKIAALLWLSLGVGLSAIRIEENRTKSLVHPFR